MPKTYYLDNLLLNAVLRQTAFTPPTTIYVALFTVAPTVSGGGTEVSGGGYVRQPVTFSAPSNGQTSNTLDVTFPLATAAWGTVVAFGLYTAATGGQLLYFNALSVSRLVSVSDQVRFPTGQLIASEA